MEKDFITFNHFYKYKTCQKYFIWNKIDTQKNDFDIDEEEQSEKFWDAVNFSELLNEENLNFVSTRASVFTSLEREFENFIQQKYRINNVYVVKSKNNEEAIIETENILRNNKYKVILYPVFKYKNAIAKPTLIDLENKKISILKLSTSTKRKDILRPFWDFWITNKIIKLENISLFLLNLSEESKKDAKDFSEVFYLNINKTKKSLSKSMEKELNNDLFFYKTIIYQQGLTPQEYDSMIKGEFVPENNIYAMISSRTLPINSKNDEYYDFETIEEIIENINEAKSINDFDNLTTEDNSLFGTNSDFNDILSLKEPAIFGYSGNILKKEKIISLIENKNIASIKTQLNDNFLYSQINSQDIKIFKSAELENIINILNDKNKRIVWYDFEGFSLPYPPMNGVLPYQQLVFQLSIKETLGNKIISNNFENENVVYDPQKLTIKTFEEIITKIYSNKADYFVVFNKGYELTRIKEMLKLIEKEDLQMHQKLSNYFAHIVKNTIDLADFFSGYSETRKNLPFIFIPELKGFYSIKKIEKYITKHNIKLEHLIIPYVELEIQNGLSAMNKAIARYIGFIGDKEWQEIKKDLKKYCENDVMAMIMVKDFINFLIKEKTQKSKK
ncbi:DUF2779 domain-containing protein [Mycoplasma sp. 480]|uniref:DUF2779 domain-containing protein n=1 Tax=Mycoplasma sp. 480 TaxID=3440155 RepID=UPI003F514248